MITPNLLAIALRLASATPLELTVGELKPAAKMLYTLEATYQQERDSLSNDMNAIGFETPYGQRALALIPAKGSAWGVAWKNGNLQSIQLESARMGAFGWDDSAAVPSLKQILSNSLSDSSGWTQKSAAVHDTILGSRSLRLFGTRQSDTVWAVAIDTASGNTFAMFVNAGQTHTLGYPWVWVIVTVAASDTGPIAYTASQLQKVAKDLCYLENSYIQKKDSYTAELTSIGFGGGHGLALLPLQGSAWGMAWNDGNIQSIQLGSGRIGAFGWDDSVAVPSLKQILSNTMIDSVGWKVSPASVRDTVLNGRSLRLFGVRQSDTVWAVALDTVTGNSFAMFVNAGRTHTLGYPWVPISPRSVPSQTLTSILMYSEVWLQEHDYFTSSLDSMGVTADMIPAGKKVMLQDTLLKQSLLVLLYDPTSHAIDVGRVSSQAWQQTWTIGTGDTIWRHPALRSKFDVMMNRKSLLPGRDQGWALERDTLRSGDSLAVFDCYGFAHQDTSVWVALEVSGSMARARMRIGAQVLELGFTEAAAAVGWVGSRRKIMPVRQELSIDVAGRSKKRKTMGMTTIGLPH
jgi:hypothetical protein